MRTVPVQLVCRECGSAFRTTVRGSGTTCRHCGRQRYVQVNQAWEGPTGELIDASRHPALNRPPQTCSCRACGHAWSSRAADGTSLRCPACRHPTRVRLRRGEPSPPPHRPTAPTVTPRQRATDPAPPWHRQPSPSRQSAAPAEPEQPGGDVAAASAHGKGARAPQSRGLPGTELPRIRSCRRRAPTARVTGLVSPPDRTCEPSG